MKRILSIVAMVMVMFFAVNPSNANESDAIVKEVEVYCKIASNNVRDLFDICVDMQVQGISRIAEVMQKYKIGSTNEENYTKLQSAIVYAINECGEASTKYGLTNYYQTSECIDFMLEDAKRAGYNIEP